MNPTDIIRGIQKAEGLVVDGQAGPRTWEKIRAKYGLEAPPVQQAGDSRSERNILTLHEDVRALARELLREAASRGITAVVTSGTRTYEEQNALYEQGRSAPGNRVTNARGGYSNHNFGIAFDVTIFGANGQPIWESPRYAELGTIGKSLGLSWGGDWENFRDEPHFELRPSWAKSLSESDMLARLRKEHEGSAA